MATQPQQTVSSIDDFRNQMINGSARAGGFHSGVGVGVGTPGTRAEVYSEGVNNSARAEGYGEAPASYNNVYPMQRNTVPMESMQHNSAMTDTPPTKMHYGEMMNRAGRLQRQYTVPNLPNVPQQQAKRAASLNGSNMHRPRGASVDQQNTAATAPPTHSNLLFRNMPYPMRRYIADIAKQKIYEFVETGNVSIEQILDQQYWQPVIDQLFSNTSTCTISKTTQNTNRHFMYLTKMFPAMCQSARYLNVSRFEAYPNQVFTQVLSNDTIFFSCLRLTFRIHYKDGSYVTHYSQFKGVFNRNFKIDWMDFVIHSFVPGIEWGALESALANPAHSAHISEHTIPIDPFNSNIHETAAAANKGESKNTLMQKFATITQLRSNFDIFRNISAIGVHNDVVRSLQINEIMSDLRAVRIYQRKFGIGSPLDAMRAFVDNNAQHLPRQSASPHIPHASPQKNRTASVPVSGSTTARKNILRTERSVEQQHYNQDDLWQLYPSEQQAEAMGSSSGPLSDGSAGSAPGYNDSNVPNKRQKF